MSIFKENGKRFSHEEAKQEVEPIKSFAELEKSQEKGVSVEEVKATLKKYAESGFSINASVVISLIENGDFAEDDIKEIVSLSQKGKDMTHEDFEFQREEYQKVIDYMEGLLESKK